jgi:sugar-specific transcriptional regulator TrmB
MVVNEEYVSTLVELGLTKMQAKIYLQLTKMQAVTAQETSIVSGVARPDIYRVFGELENAGLLERLISKPERFHAIPMEDCVTILMQKRIMKTSELNKKTLKLIKSSNRSIEYFEPDEKFQFILIPGKSNVYSKSEKMLKNVQESICIAGFRKRVLAWLSNYLPLIQETLSRKVDCRIIMPKTEKKRISPMVKALANFSNFSLREAPIEPKAGFGVWDRKEVLISTSATDTSFPLPTIWSNNKATVDLVQDYFEFLWKKAEKIKLT